jgi:putative transposase
MSSRIDVLKSPLSSRETLLSVPREQWDKLRRRASLLKSAGPGPLSSVSAERLAAKLQVHRSTVYRWHKRYWEAQTVSALQPRGVGFPREGGTRLSEAQERVVEMVIGAMQRQAHAQRVVDVVKEVERLCRSEHVPAPSRRSVDRRVRRHPELGVKRRHGTADARPALAPGTYRIGRPLQVVQIDHTLADIEVVDELFRRPIGRPYLTIVLDIASRAVLAAVVSFQPPSAATVALSLSRACSPKADWITSLGLQIDWPMQGLPGSLHLDNGPEFHSKALERGCAELGIELIYRPPGRPHFGGHVERLIGTLMARLSTLPGATGASVKDRKRRQPEKRAVLTLAELERWLVLEVAEVYHHTSHRGLPGATPYGAWKAQEPTPTSPETLRQIPFVFLPAEERKVRRDGVHFENVRYWHPIFSTWALRRKKLLVHYDPRDVSRLYARGVKNEILEIPYADLRNPAVSLWELKAAAAHLRKVSRLAVDERRLFGAIEKQRAIVQAAGAATRKARRADSTVPARRPIRGTATAPDATAQAPVEEQDAAAPYPAEIWDDQER